MAIRILYNARNLQELFKVELSYIRLWTQIGILPCVEGSSPIQYDKDEIDKWLAEGKLEKYRPTTYYHRKGIYLKPPK